MSLDPAGLKSDLAAIAADPPATAAACAQAWADGVEAYCSGIVPPSTAVSAAAAALVGALTTAFQASAAAPGMESAFASFASTVGSGMAPAFTATPPPAPVGFATQFAGAFPATHAQAGEEIGGLIHTWMVSGSAVPSGGGGPIPWS